MASKDGAQELVILFDAGASKIDLEMRYGQFNGLLGQKAKLGSHAGGSVNAVYVQVGAGLTVQALVFFRFKVNESGFVDPAFNLPLDYMAQNAGAGPDLGNGPISMACRSQCPIPWHAINMWEPVGEGDRHSAMLVQKAVWRNRLGLKPLPMQRRSGAVTPMRTTARATARKQLEKLTEQVGQAANGSTGMTSMQAMDERLTARFGQTGRLSVSEYTQQHREQVGQVAEQFRSELERQQQSYLEQIKACRQEIQKLKSSLRQEQERNRRLQQLLRGDV